ncbi:polysaccharide biosynthesis protein [Flavobacterium sp. 14A]|uniref:polysaccharide biosynthesis protein n=1 Tax=Flavobacterium sp. 14A TaxID=2735896 RepID=UPI00156EE0D3|nr:polysaccharide biosynthesis protein [Flavobacterium sp. 14A]NRT13274.1 O-antigen/teichoic acid export membrane protein [Flavobacterium sp. 14A]
MTDSNSKRIAKNTLLLYFRMFITMGVSLYTSRVVLNTLGISDYGVYNVVGGVVAMFSFLNGSLSGATSRFLTFELGTQNKERLNKVFSSALTVHLGLAIIILVIGETIGLWLLENKLVIAENRMFAARIVYQLSIISCIVAIIHVPSSAAIIAHERMNIYAYVSIVEVGLKLLVVFLLLIGNFDKLILYGVLTLIVTIIITLIYQIYSYRNFSECKFRISLDKEMMMPMLSYSGWDLYGNLSVMVRGQGINILLNTFFGTIINAASGIATQVQNAIAGFADNFLVAVRPQIVKNYASGNIVEMQRLIFNASKFSFLLLFLISFTFIVEIEFVMKLWLVKVPLYAIIFCQLSLLNNLVSIMFRTVMFSIHATGKMKRISFINGTIYIMVLPISYGLLKLGFSPIAPFLINIFLLTIGCASNLITLNLYIPEFSISEFLKKVVMINLIIVVLSSIMPLIIYYSMEEGFLRFLIVGFTSVVSIGIATYYIAIDNDMRKASKSYLLNKISLK